MSVRGLLGVLMLSLAGCDCSRPAAIADVTLDFGEVAVGASSTKQLVVRNTSNASVELRELSGATTPFRVRFSPLTVPALGVATFDVTFVPSATGAVELVERLVSSGGDSRVVLRGTGKMASTVRCDTFADVDFGPILVGQTKTVALALPSPALVNGDASAFVVSANGVLFVPPAAGMFTAQVEVQQAGCPAVRFAVRGESVAKLFGCLGEPIDFGKVNPGATKVTTVTVRNASDQNVSISQLLVQPPFRLESVPAVSVAARSSTTLVVSFSPPTAGDFEGEIAASTGFTCRLTGKGGGPDIDVPLALDVGQVPFFASAPMPSFVTRTLTVKNTGDTELKVTSVGVTSGNGSSPVADLTMTPAAPFVVPAGGQVGVEVKVAPSAANLHQEWTLAFSSDDVDEPVVTTTVRAQSVELPPCNYSVDPVSLSFGRVAPGEPRSMTFKIRNLGMNTNETCLLTGLDLAPGSAPEFSLPGGPVLARVLMPGEALSVEVRASSKVAPAMLTNVTGNLRLGISSPTAPQRLVPLTAQVGYACLVFTPRELQFGSVQVGCASSTRTVSVFNTCNTPVTIDAVTLPGTELTTTFAPITLPRSTTPFQVPVTYRPSAVGDDSGFIRVRSTQQNEMVEDLVAFTGRGSTDGANVDTFLASAKADLLVVRDDSGSMMAYEPRVVSHMNALLQKLLASGIDFHLGIIYSEQNARLGLLQGAPPVLTRLTPNVAALWATRVATPLTGAVEIVAGAAVAALKDPRNVGFLRADVPVSILMLSDADEAPSEVPSLSAQLQVARGRFHVIGPMGCGLPDTGQTLLVNALGGRSASLCSSDWTSLIDGVVTDAAGTDRFTLTADPDNGVQVEVDGLLVFPTSGSNTVWTFDPLTRQVRFEPLYRPPAGSTVRVSYTAACN